MRTLRIFFYVLAVLAAGDVATTFYALHHGGAEANRWMTGVVQSLPLMCAVKVAWLVGGYAVMRYAYRKCVRDGRSLHMIYAPLLVCVAVGGWLVLHNLEVIRGL